MRSNRHWVGRLVIGSVIVAGVTGTLLWRPDRDSQTATPSKPAGPLPAFPKFPSPAQDYAGAAVCSECHEEIAARYSHHPMANSLSAVVPEALHSQLALTDTARFRSGNRTDYEVLVQNGELVHREIGRGSQDQELYSYQVAIRYLLGSGQRGRSFVHQRDGYLFLSPISWYQQQQRWDLSPEYEPENHLRFERPANDRCLQCHAGRLNYSGEPTTALAQPYLEPPFLEMAIQCERCHGPAQRHVQWQKAEEKVGDDPIVQLGTLDSLRRDAVCNQCHLTGDAQILRHGRRHRDFRPGDRIGDIWSVFLAPPKAGEFEAVSHVQQMRSSRCYLATGQTMGCITCHDPHGAPAEEEKSAYYQSRCIACHQPTDCLLDGREREAEPARGNCVACHMPALGAKDVPHTAQTDHRIRTRTESSETPKTSKNERQWSLFEEDTTPLNESERHRAWGLALAKRAEAERDLEQAAEAARRLEWVLPLLPGDADILDGLALVRALEGNIAAAKSHWLSILNSSPRHKDALYSLTVVADQEGDYRRAAIYGERLLEIWPWDAEMLLRMANISLRLGRNSEAETYAWRAMQQDPSRIEYFQWYADNISFGDPARRSLVQKRLQLSQ